MLSIINLSYTDLSSNNLLLYINLTFFLTKLISSIFISIGKWSDSLHFSKILTFKFRLLLYTTKSIYESYSFYFLVGLLFSGIHNCKSLSSFSLKNFFHFFSILISLLKSPAIITLNEWYLAYIYCRQYFNSYIAIFFSFFLHDIYILITNNYFPYSLNIFIGNIYFKPSIFSNYMLNISFLTIIISPPILLFISMLLKFL